MESSDEIQALLEQARETSETLSFEGEIEKALAQIDAAEARLRGRLQPAHLGLIWRAKSKIYSDHFRFELALEAAQTSARYFLEAGDPFEAAKSRVRDVHDLGYLARLEEAVILKDELVETFRDFPIGTFFVLNNLCRAYVYNWENDKAITLSEETYRYCQNNDLPAFAWSTYAEKGVAYEQRGEFVEARESYQTILEQLTFEDDPMLIGKTTFNMAAVQLKLGEYESALAYLEQARDLPPIYDALQDQAHAALFEGWVRMAIGENELATGLLQEAEGLFRQYGYHIEQAEAAMLLGTLLGRSDRLEQVLLGIDYFDTALAFFNEDRYRYLEGQAQLFRGEILLRLRRYPEASDAFQAARLIFQTMGVERFEGAARFYLAEIALQGGTELLPILDELNDISQRLDLLPPDIGIQILHRQGGLSFQLDRYDEAFAYLKEAFSRAEAHRDRLNRHEHQAWLGRYVEAISQDLLTTLHAWESPERKLETAMLLDRLQMGGLHGLIQTISFQALIDEPEKAALFAAREQLYRQIDQLYQAELVQVDEPFASIGLDEKAKVSQRRSSQLRRELKRLDESISRRFQLHTTHNDDETTADFKQRLNTLPGNRLILRFYDVKNELWVLAFHPIKGTIDRLQLGITGLEVERMWKQSARLLPHGLDDARQAARRQKRLGQLYKRLIEPINRWLAPDRSAQKWVIIPSGNLWEIPFGALFDETSSQSLSEQVELSFSYSFSWLIQQSHLEPASGHPLLVGYGGERSDSYYLPAVEEEIVGITAVLEGEDPKLLKGKEALPAPIYHQIQEGGAPAILHVATHIEFEPSHPMRSAIKLADRTRLTAADLYVRPNLLLGTLVVLSGCDSGRVKPTGTEMLGLNSGFLYAGARGIVSTLWPVSDECTRYFMERFYTYLSQPEVEPATALSLTVREMQKEERFGSPFYWAPFYYLGA